MRTPPKTDAQIGEYAINLRDESFRIWQCREDGPVDAANWQRVGALEKADKMELVLEDANLRSKWLYAAEMDVSELPESWATTTAEHDYYVRLSKNSRIGGKTQADAYVKVVEWLIEHAGLMAHISIPYGLQQKSYVLNSTPEQSDGTEMHRPRELANGLYLETTVSKDVKKEHIKRLVDECDQKVSFGGEW